ncbi:variant-silencing SET domain-containing protein-like, partial [Aphis craccivora]
NDCKKTWNNLRDAFRRAMKKSQTTSGQSAKYIKKWKYEEEMSFLRPHMRERDTISSLNLSDGESEANNDENGIVEVEEGDIDFDINSSITHINTESPTISSSAENKIRSQKELTKTNIRKRKQPIGSASATLMEYIIKTKA